MLLCAAYRYYCALCLVSWTPPNVVRKARTRFALMLCLGGVGTDLTGSSSIFSVWYMPCVDTTNRVHGFFHRFKLAFRLIMD